jgi:hypothetical protein
MATKKNWPIVLVQFEGCEHLFPVHREKVAQFVDAMEIWSDRARHRVIEIIPEKRKRKRGQALNADAPITPHFRS